MKVKIAQSKPVNKFMRQIFCLQVRQSACPSNSVWALMSWSGRLQQRSVDSLFSGDGAFLGLTLNQRLDVKLPRSRLLVSKNTAIHLKHFWSVWLCASPCRIQTMLLFDINLRSIQLFWTYTSHPLTLGCCSCNNESIHIILWNHWIIHTLAGGSKAKPWGEGVCYE